MAPRPTAILPPLKAQPSFDQLSNALSIVEHLYAEIPVIQLVSSEDSTPSSAINDHIDEDVDDDDVLRASGVERQFALSWALRLSGLTLDWVDPEQAEQLQGRAAKVIADAARMADEGALDREFVFPIPALTDVWTQIGVCTPFCSPKNTINGCQHASQDYGVKNKGDSSAPPKKWLLTLRDEALPPATSQEGMRTTTEHAISSRLQDAATAVGLQTWAAAAVLCDYLARFWTPSLNEGETRVLELGAGTGLVGILAAKLAFSHANCKVRVVLTDYHERVLANLRHNISLNFAIGCPCVSADVLDWAEVDKYAKSPVSAKDLSEDHGAGQEPWWITDARSGGYELILGADVMYSPEHAVWLASSLAVMIPPRGRCREAEAHILCAVRDKGRFAAMQLAKAADQVFNQATSPEGIASHLKIAATYKLPKVAGLGRADEHGWVHWVFRRRV